MLGGNTIVIDEGQVLQHGPTLEVFHHPASVRVTQVFSEPPMNLANGTIADGRFALEDGHGRPLARSSKDGRRRLVPPRISRQSRSALQAVGRRHRNPGRRDLAEVSGSETFIHLKHSGADWVVQEEGVHTLRIGDPISLHLRPDRFFLFGQDGLLKASPPVADAMIKAA